MRARASVVGRAVAAGVPRPGRGRRQGRGGGGAGGRLPRDRTGRELAAVLRSRGVLAKAKPPVDPELPGWLEQAANFTVAAARHALAGFPIAPPELAEARLAICRGCDRYRASDERCAECGCNVHGKASWENERCPLLKWPGDVPDRSRGGARDDAHFSREAEPTMRRTLLGLVVVAALGAADLPPQRKPAPTRPTRSPAWSSTTRRRAARTARRSRPRCAATTPTSACPRASSPSTGRSGGSRAATCWGRAGRAAVKMAPGSGDGPFLLRARPLGRKVAPDHRGPVRIVDRAAAPAGKCGSASSPA